MGFDFIEKRKWFELGVYPDGDVDIADSDNSTVIRKVPRELADHIIKAHNDALEWIDETLNDLWPD